MGKVSHPVSEVVIRTVIVANQKRMSAVTELPIKAGVGLAKGTEGEGISGFLREFRDDFSVRD